MASQLPVVLLAALTVFAFALPIPSHSDERDLYNVLPVEIKSFYDALTDADLKIFVALLPQLEGKDDNQIYEILKANDAGLAERAKTMYDAISSKINALPAVAKKFMTDLVSTVETFNDVRVYQFRKRAVFLPKTEQDAIIAVFPSLRPLFNS